MCDVCDAPKRVIPATSLGRLRREAVGRPLTLDGQHWTVQDVELEDKGSPEAWYTLRALDGGQSARESACRCYLLGEWWMSVAPWPYLVDQRVSTRRDVVVA